MGLSLGEYRFHFLIQMTRNHIGFSFFHHRVFGGSLFIVIGSKFVRLIQVLSFWMGGLYKTWLLLGFQLFEWLPRIFRGIFAFS